MHRENLEYNSKDLQIGMYSELSHTPKPLCFKILEPGVA